MGAILTEIGLLLIENATGLIRSRAVGDKALHTSAAQGNRVQIATNSAGQHQIDLVQQSITPLYLDRESSKPFGGALVASDVDPGGVFALQNNTGSDLWLDQLNIIITNTPAGACELDVGITVDPMPPGGSGSIFNNIDVRNGGVAREFDSRVDGVRPGVLWPNNYWLCATKVVGATLGMTGRLLGRIVDHNLVKPVF
jgi:hypothetical protein